MQVFNDLNELSNSSEVPLESIGCPDLRFAGRIEANVGSEPQAGETHSNVHAASSKLPLALQIRRRESWATSRSDICLLLSTFPAVSGFSLSYLILSGHVQVGLMQVR